MGDSGNCGAINRGFLVENGGPIVDLQTLVLPGSDVTISETNYINDAGEISGFGKNSNGDHRGILLIPCDEKHPGECEDYSMIEVPDSRTGASPTISQGGESPTDQPTLCNIDSGEGFTFPANQRPRATNKIPPRQDKLGWDTLRILAGAKLVIGRHRRQVHRFTLGE